MESKIVIYFFTEVCQHGVFSESNLPFVKSQIALHSQKNRKDAFVLCGGVKVVDYYSDEKTHVRISFWKTRSGYSNWMKETENLTQERERYLSENKIAASLAGPFEAYEFF